MKNLVAHYPTNTVGRDLVVGDIHGCINRLRSVLKACEFDRTRDILYSVGDLIDRGPNSLQCLDLIIEPWFRAVMGNHEYMMLASVTSSHGRASGESDLWRRNGGQWGDDLPPETLRELATVVSDLPLMISVGEGASRFNVLHAEFFGTDEDMDALSPGNLSPVFDSLLFGREMVRANREPQIEGLSLTIVGHTIRRETQRIGQHLFIDTGSYVDGGRITIVEPGTGKEWHS